MRKLISTIILLIAVSGIIISGISVYDSSHDPEKIIYSRIASVNTQFEHSNNNDTNVSIFLLQVRPMIWNTADRPVIVTFNNPRGYFLRIISLTSNEDMLFDQRVWTPAENQIEFEQEEDIWFTVGGNITSFGDSIIPGNYEIYFGQSLRERGHASSAYLNVSKNGAVTTQYDSPDIWSHTYHNTNILFLSITVTIIMTIILYRKWKKWEY